MAKNKKAIKARFLELLSQGRGNVQGTISKMGETKETRISRGYLYVWKSQDKKFSDEWDRIADDSRQEVRESLISALIKAGLAGNVGAIALYFKLVEGWIERKEFIPVGKGQDNPLRFYHSLTPEDRRAHITTLRDKLARMLDENRITHLF